MTHLGVRMLIHTRGPDLFFSTMVECYSQYPPCLGGRGLLPFRRVGIVGGVGEVEVGVAAVEGPPPGHRGEELPPRGVPRGLGVVVPRAPVRLGPSQQLDGADKALALECHRHLVGGSVRIGTRSMTHLQGECTYR